MDDTRQATPDRPADGKRGSSLLLIIAWLVVLAPAVWGVSQTVQKSLALFHGNASATTAPASQPTTQR